MTTKTTDATTLNTESLTQAGRKLWLAGLGVVGAADAQGREFFAELVERGRAAEGEHSPLRPLHEASDRVRDLGERVERSIEDRVAATLRRLGVPARSDFEQLSAQVERLTRKVSAVAEAESKAA
ncbi:MAG: phasin family protein [Acidobacteriota bacterium]